MKLWGKDEQPVKPKGAGLHPQSRPNGIIYHVAGNLRYTSYGMHRIICGEISRTNSLLEPIVQNRQAVEFILDSERRGGKREAAERLFNRIHNYGISFTMVSSQRKVVLLARGICVKEPWLYAPGTMLEMCKFLKFQAEDMGYEERSFLTENSFESSIFWHTALLSSYYYYVAKPNRDR